MSVRASHHPTIFADSYQFWIEKYHSHTKPHNTKSVKSLKMPRSSATVLQHNFLSVHNDKVVVLYKGRRLVLKTWVSKTFQWLELIIFFVQIFAKLSVKLNTKSYKKSFQRTEQFLNQVFKQTILKRALKMLLLEVIWLYNTYHIT